MNELDRRIAEEVMGEPEPPVPGFRVDCPIHSLRGNWRYYDDADRWRPVRFSSSMGLAMCVVDKVLVDYGLAKVVWFTLDYLPALKPENRWCATFRAQHGRRYSPPAYAPTASEAIVRCVLELVSHE